MWTVACLTARDSSAMTSSYMALSYEHMWRKLEAAQARVPSQLEPTRRPARAVILELLKELSTTELLEVSVAAATAASKLCSESAPGAKILSHASIKHNAAALSSRASLNKSRPTTAPPVRDARPDSVSVGAAAVAIVPPPLTVADAVKFQSRRPFHPARLEAALQQVQSALKLRPQGASNGSSDAATGGGGRGGASLSGIAWLATQPGLQAVVGVDDAGVVRVEPGDAWWACLPRSKWPPGLEEDLVPPLWQVCTSPAHLPHMIP